jgi:transposase
MVECGNFWEKEEPLLGESRRSERIFYYVRMEDIVPENHLLRLIDRHIDLKFIRDKVKHLYSHTGRPSIDPEVLLRMLLIGYLYGITSERRLCEEVQMHIGYRWFVGLNLEDKVPDHSTLSKNRHERFTESDLFQRIFDEIVNQCVSQGLLTGKHLTVDSTYVQANAAIKSLEPIVVNMGAGEYIEELERENPVTEEPWEPGEDYPHRGQKIGNGTHRSKTDPDARLARKSLKANTQLYHGVTYVMDNRSRIIVGADVGKPDRKTDCEKALEQIRRILFTFGIKPESLGADKGYSTGEFINALVNEKVRPHIPIMDSRSQNDRGIYSIEQFSFDPSENRFLCPEGKTLKYWGIHKLSKQHVYRASTKDCKVCLRKAECTKDRARSLSYHIYEESINQARQINQTRGYRISQRMRKRIEELFGEAKEWMGLRRAKFRRHKFFKEQTLMTATAQNIKRMVKLLSQGGYTNWVQVAQQLGETFLSKTFSKLFGLMTLFRYRTQCFLLSC